MRDFGYSKRGHDVNEAQAEVHAAFKGVRDRNDTSDPRTRRWLDAVAAFRAAYARVYSDALREVDNGEKRASELNTANMLDFLEADPIFFRSGYMKQKLLRELKKRKLDQHEGRRLQSIILSVVQKNDHRREFLGYCRAAANVDDERFRGELIVLEQSDEPHVSQRANWVLAALDSRWLDLKRAARGHERRGDMYHRAKEPRISR
jgi:hypothetical protein